MQVKQFLSHSNTFFKVNRARAVEKRSGKPCLIHTENKKID